MVRNFLARIQLRARRRGILIAPPTKGLEYIMSGNPQGPASTILFSSSTTFTSLYGTCAIDVSDSSTEFCSDIAQTMDVQQDLSSRSRQDETVKSSKVVEDPICLFGQFVSAVSSDALKDVRPRSEVSWRLLCYLFRKADCQPQFSTFVGDLRKEANRILRSGAWKDYVEAVNGI